MNPAAVLASNWNVQIGSTELYDGKSLTAARWRHNYRELGAVDLPTNILFHRNVSARAWRVRGNNRERSTSKSGGNGLLVQGSYGSWQYLESVDIVHIYVRNELLADLSVQEGGPGTAELRECLDLHDPLLNTLTQEVANTLGQQPRSRLHADSLGLMISMRLLKFHLDRPLSLGVKVGGLAPWQLARATEALSDRLNEEPSLDEIAALVRLSKFHLLRAFRMSTGLPPHRYLMNLRVARARQLLETTDLSVTEIAGEVGYDDPGYLARLFRRRFGTTPARYRRERRS